MHHILVVGTGSIGERHVRCLKATKRATVGICEINTKTRESVAERYDIAEIHATIQEALDRSWDAVVIATPAHLHIPPAILFAQAGISLFIEKPLSTTFEGLRQLEALIQSNNLFAAVAYVYRAHPALCAMKNAIDSGRFGEPLQIVVTCGQNFPFYRPAFRETYYRDRSTGGGAIQDALTHLINAGEWLVGPIDRIVADAAHKAVPGVEVEDTVIALVRHGLVLGSYALNQHQAPNETTITVACKHGTARCEFHNCRWSWMTEPGSTWHEEVYGPLERDTWFMRQEEYFLDGLERARPPLCSLTEGIQTLKVTMAALLSCEQGSSPILVDSGLRPGSG